MGRRRALFHRAELNLKRLELLQSVVDDGLEPGQAAHGSIDQVDERMEVVSSTRRHEAHDHTTSPPCL